MMKKLSHYTPSQTTLIVGFVYLIYIFIYLSFNQFNLSSFIWFGDHFLENKNLVSSPIKLSPRGYDGQFFYRLSLDPFTDKASDYGVKIDIPPYRQQRIFYPLLIWTLSLANPEFTVFILILINYIAICGIAFIGAKILQKQNLASIAAISFAFYPGLVISLSRSLCEPVAIFLLLLSLYFLIKNSYLLATLFLMLAVLTRETTLLVAVGSGIYWFFTKIKKYKNQKNLKVFPSYYFYTPFLLFATWQYYLYSKWGVFPIFAGKGIISVPFQGILTSFISFFSFTDPSQPIYLIEMSWIIILAGYCVYNLSTTNVMLNSIWILYGLLSLTFSVSIWSNHPSFYRATIEFNLIGNALILFSKGRHKYYFIATWLIFWMISAAVEIYIQQRIPLVY